MKRIRRNQGFTLIELMIVVALIAVIAAIAIPALLNSVRAANEASAISSLRTVSTVNEQYALRFGSYADTLANLSAPGYIDSVLGAGSKSGYVFSYTLGADAWTCSADPEEPGVTGNRHFYSDQSGVIRFADMQPASSNDTPIE